MAIRSRRFVGPLVAGLLLGAAALPVEAEGVHKELNQKIVKFAVAQKGKRIGDGGCYALPAEALKHAEAMPPSGFVWGQKLAAGDRPVPGDIVQFTGVRLVRPDGNFFIMEQHSAIVLEVHSARQITVIHQNFGNKPDELAVTTTKIDLKDVKKGRVEFFHPQPGSQK